jgi:hypothetical protein
VASSAATKASVRKYTGHLHPSTELGRYARSDGTRGIQPPQPPIRNEAIEPHTIAIITRFYGVVIIRAMRLICTI